MWILTYRSTKGFRDCWLSKRAILSLPPLKTDSLPTLVSTIPFFRLVTVRLTVFSVHFFFKPSLRKFYKRYLSCNELLPLLVTILILTLIILRSSSFQSRKVRCYCRSWPIRRATAPWPPNTTVFNMMARQHLEEHNSIRSPKDTP